MMMMREQRMDPCATFIYKTQAMNIHNNNMDFIKGEVNRASNQSFPGESVLDLIFHSSHHRKFSRFSLRKTNLMVNLENSLAHSFGAM